MVNDTITAIDEECGYSGDLGLDSMGQVVRASKELYLSPEDSRARAVLDSYREFRLACLKTSLSLLRSVQLPNHALISARLKRIESINRKITRNQFGAFSVSRMDDIIGFRIICESYLEAMSIGDRLAGISRTIKKDYVGRPHPTGSGYRAIHVIAKFDQPFKSSSVVARFEIQIRTWLQHLWACWCESQGEQIKEFNANLDQCVDNDSIEVIRSLISMSKSISEWEEKNQGKSQIELPQRGDPYQLAVASVGSEGQNLLIQCGTDANFALENVRYSEKRNLHPLLLLGVDAANLNLESLLSMTHPKFVGSKSPYPEGWMPK